MGKIHEGIKTFNTTVRTAIAATFVGVIGAGGFYGYSEYSKHERALATATAEAAQLKSELLQLSDELKKKNQQIEKMETSMRLLKTDQRLARLNVLGVDKDEKTGQMISRLEFVELSPNGQPISQPKRFELPGEQVYIDNWIIKFDDKYVEQGDVQRGTSLCLFKRVFTDQVKPADGVSLDEVGMRPQAYGRGGKMSEFEQELWKDFWQFANDPDKAQSKGIRAANGEAISVKAVPGKSYELELRASGGLSLVNDK